MGCRTRATVRRRRGQRVQLCAVCRDGSLCELSIGSRRHRFRTGFRRQRGLASSAGGHDRVCLPDRRHPPGAIVSSPQRCGCGGFDRRRRGHDRTLLVCGAPACVRYSSRWQNCAASEGFRTVQRGCPQGLSAIRSGRRNRPKRRHFWRRPIQKVSSDLPPSDTSVVAVSIIVPVRNEAENVKPLIAEIAAALDGRWNYEIIYVNDGSTDASAERLATEMERRANLRQIRHAASAGQSAAVRSGVRAARGAIAATLDGDGQNDPAFLPHLIAAIENGGEGVGLAAGQRVGRKDSGFKRIQSRIANGVRKSILRDGTRDTGCGLKAFRREVFLTMPYFDGLHRFLPALVRREGYEIAYVDVVDRPRRSGVSNYGFFDRLWIGIMDIAGVWWLIRRKKPTPDVTEVTL